MRGRGEGTIRKRRRADGAVYWEARVMIDGRQRSFYHDAKSGAMAAARQARADVERGALLPTESLTVAQYLGDWLESYARNNVRARTYDSYRQLTQKHIIPAIGRRRLVQLTPGHVQTMLAGLLANGYSVSTASRVRAVLSSALTAAQLDHGLPRNVASLAKMPKTDKPDFKPEVVTPTDARTILRAFEGTRIEPLVLFSVATGVRQGELLALRWQDIDLDSRTVTIRHAVDKQDGVRVLARPKSPKAHRTLALPGLALRALELRRLQEEEDRSVAGSDWQDLDLVFPNPTGGIRDRHAVTRGFRRILDRNEIEPIRWHALRRLFAALLQDQGIPLERIRDLMGHSALRVTEHYAYTMPETLLDDMSAIDDALDAN